jgi:hypothetical protein
MCLLNDGVNISNCIPLNGGTINKQLIRKDLEASSHGLTWGSVYHPGICLDGLKKTTKAYYGSRPGAGI